MAVKPQPPAGRLCRLKLEAARLVLGYECKATVRRKITTGILTNATPVADRGRGRTCFVWSDEVDMLMHHGDDACRDYRRAKGRE